MSRDAFYEKVSSTLREIDDDGLWKPEQILTSPQGGSVEVKGSGRVLNFSANKASPTVVPAPISSRAYESSICKRVPSPK